MSSLRMFGHFLFHLETIIKCRMPPSWLASWPARAYAAGHTAGCHKTMAFERYSVGSTLGLQPENYRINVNWVHHPISILRWKSILFLRATWTGQILESSKQLTTVIINIYHHTLHHILMMSLCWWFNPCRNPPEMSAEQWSWAARRGYLLQPVKFRWRLPGWHGTCMASSWEDDTLW